MLFDTVGIVGVGLIGGSIGVALKERSLAARVIGIGYRHSTLARARRRGAIDQATCDIARGVRSADLVLVATPAGIIPDVLKEAARHVPQACILADVGSTKSWIVKKAGGLRSFVPSHPIAGSEARGNEAARGDRALWEALGMCVVRMTAARHDEILGATSHLPHVLASALAGSTRESHLGYAGKGFLDTTRIASGDPKVWSDILLTNRAVVADRLKNFRRLCAELERILRDGDERKLRAFLARGKERRDGAKNNHKSS